MSVSGMSLGLYAPKAPFSDGSRLYLADQTNNRVLIWNSIPTASNVPPNVVVGQPNLESTGLASTASNLWHPAGVYSNGTQLYIADSGNSRVLIMGI